MSSLEHPVSLKPASSDSPTQTSGPTPYLPGSWQVAHDPIIHRSSPKAHDAEIAEDFGGIKPYMGPPPSEPGSESEPVSSHLQSVRPHLVHLLCFLLTFIVYVAFIPKFILYSSPPTGDQPFYLMDVISMVQDGDLNVKNNYDNSDFDKFYALAPHPPDFVGISAPYPLPRQLANTPARPPDEEYAFHLPGLSVLLVPAWIIGSWFDLWWPATIVAMCLIGALVALNVLLLAHQTSGRLWIAVAVWLPIAFSNPIMTYSYMIFTELTVGLLLIYVFRRLALGWEANGRLMLLFLGICIGYIPWLAWRCMPIAAMLCVYAAIQWWRYRRELGKAQSGKRRQQAEGNNTPFNTPFIPPFIPPSSDGTPVPVKVPSRAAWPRGNIFEMALLFLPIVVAVLSIFGYNMYLFDRPLPDNKVPELGGQSPFYLPWSGIEELTTFVTNGFGLLFDQQFGLLIYAPIYLLAAVGMIAMFQKRGPGGRALLASMALVVLPYLGLIVAFHFWTGIWGPPARYLTTLVPLLAAPLATSLLALSGSWLYKIIYTALALPGFAFIGIMLQDARRMWPLGNVPVLAWWIEAPESPLRIDLRRFLPFFSPPDQFRLPETTAWTTGLSLLIVLFCYFLMARRRGKTYALGPRRLPYATQGIVWLGAIGVIGSGWFAMNHNYLVPTTVLVQQNRWQLPPSATFGNPSGIAYMDGKVYITAFGPRLEPSGTFGQGEMGVLDLGTGAYTIVQPVSSGDPSSVLPWVHPGDVKAGPQLADGQSLIYVLNNGENERSLYVMKPNGEVVNQIRLDNKSTIARGLHLDPRGYMFVGDMVGGRVLRYGMAGGQPINAFTGMNPGLNNITGLFVDQDGTIYTTETFEWVQKLDAEGKFIRKYDIGCRPVYIAPNGDWLDVSCHNGIVSINKKTDEIKRSKVAEGGPQLQSPTGLTYGSDGTLYVLDGNMLIAYSIQH